MSTLLQQAYICSVFWSVAGREQSHLLVMAKRERLEVSRYCAHRERGALAGGWFVCICLLRASAFPLCHRASWLLRVHLCCAPLLLSRWSRWSLHGESIAATLHGGEGQRDAGKRRVFLYLLVNAWPEFPAAVVVGRVFFLIKSTQRQASNPRGLLWELWSSERF